MTSAVESAGKSQDWDRERYQRQAPGQRASLQWAEGDVVPDIGFLHLPYAQIIDLGPGHTPKDLRAISWRVSAMRTIDGTMGRSLTITGWVDADGPVETEDFIKARRFAKEHGFPYPGLIRDSNLFLLLDKFALRDEEDDIGGERLAEAADYIRSSFTSDLRDSSPSTLGEFAWRQRRRHRGRLRGPIPVRLHAAGRPEDRHRLQTAARPRQRPPPTRPPRTYEW